MNISFTRPEWIFKTNPEKLSGLLLAIDDGKLALPYFQRDWVWAPENIQELLISVVQAFPAGSLLMLGHTEKMFHVKYFSGTNISDNTTPQRLVLDGQQRLTSLYQTLQSKEGIKKENSKERHFFYLSMQRLIDSSPIEDAIFYVDNSRVYKEGRQVVYDLSMRDAEFEYLCLPFNCIIYDEYRKWRKELERYYRRQKKYEDNQFYRLDDQIEEIHAFYIQSIQNYEFPVIELHEETPLRAVCHIFEKVNTTGVELTVFELLTATLWAQGIDLPKMWRETKEALNDLPNMEGIDIDRVTFLQTISLLATFHKKRVSDSQRIGVSCKRDDLLELSKKEINKFWPLALEGYRKSAKILYENGIYSDRLLPYKTMLAPLAAICAQVTVDYGDIKLDTVYNKIKVWFWRSVFSWRYSSGIETKAGKDFEQVIGWINSSDEPDVVRQFEFNPDVLYELTTIRNAVYSGMLCLILRQRPLDFRSGFGISTQLFHDEKVDHHHIFPSKYLQRSRRIESRRINCALNKTLIDASTNRSIGAKSPAIYIAELAKELPPGSMSKVLSSHLLDESLMQEAPITLETAQDAVKLVSIYEKFLAKRLEEVSNLIKEATNL